MLIVIQIQTVRHTDGIGWYFNSRQASVLIKIDTPEKNQSIFYLQLEVLDWPQARNIDRLETSQFSIQALLLNDCNLLSVLIDAIIMSNFFSGMEQFVLFGNRHYIYVNLF